MGKLGKTSFRRILLSRLLLLSVPVLLIGEYVAYRKARSALLETARQNLTASAARKAESIEQSIEALSTNLLMASDSAVLKNGDRDRYQAFTEQFAAKLPNQINCVQLIDIPSEQVIASSCGVRVPEVSLPEFAPLRDRLLPDSSQIQIQPRLPNGEKQTRQSTQLELWFGAPVYNNSGKLSYILTINSSLLKQEKVEPGLLTGYPVVINQQGTILAHPIAQKVGTDIKDQINSDRLQSVLKNAIAGRENFLHLLSFEDSSVELLAGYSSMDSPVTTEVNQKWAILTFTRLEDALAGLEGIREVLIILGLALVAASFIATLYISFELARPLEKLRDYALHQEKLNSHQQIPHNFKIQEFEQLALALNGMVARLKDWAEELENAWREAQTANQLKNEFLATISHELRTPLNGIIGSIQLIQDGFCDDREEELEFLEKGNEAALHLLSIVNDILDIAKIEEGKLSVNLEPVLLNELLDEAINIQSAIIRQKGLSQKVILVPAKIFVNADPGKLKQVLLNILGNAVKFTESGSITIRTRIYQESPDELTSQRAGKLTAKLHSLEKKVVISVIDTGIGIDPIHQQKLFRPFVMVDGSRTRKFGGTGLGLAISRNLMKLMDGDITLSSPGEGQGTTVEIILPIAKISYLTEVEDRAATVRKTS
ncbi:MAG: ATP-binding protein [Oscillatoria sp. PMC 1051.18]|nr:ATP-binding protein [Oscillatoria sp. PMC 1050.18]MEC5032868.1 ATP-binding protein [Oscillatoria sp. PMC 1051.18]